MNTYHTRKQNTQKSEIIDSKNTSHKKSQRDTNTEKKIRGKVQRCNIWVIPRNIYNSKIFSHETFFKMFFKQFKSIRIFLFRCYMKNVIVMNFFRFAA